MEHPAKNPAEQKKPLLNAMTVDVEDYFQVSAFEKYIKRAQWQDIPCRVENNTNRVLEIFAEKNIKATFFVLGWVAERYPKLIRKVVDSGHELASHGYDHVRVTNFDKSSFYSDITTTKKILEDISGVEVIGYRAPSYSIGATNLWALELLEEAGYRYSSSIYPIKHDLYGMPDSPRFAFRPNKKNGKKTAFIEIPVTTTRLLGKNFPCGGGGYFRLLPYFWSKYAIGRVNRKDKEPAIFYFHPWEIDPEQPQQHNISLKTKVRHYTNLKKMENRLKILLDDFVWGRVDGIYLERT